jgi:type I restriction enzyme, S subunit
MTVLREAITIGDVAEVFDGPHATPKTIDEGPIFLGIKSLNNGRLDLTETRHVSEEDYSKWTRRVTPCEGDIVFSYETRIGDAAVIPANLKCCLGRRMGLVRPNPKRLNHQYFLYQYLSPDYQSFLKTRTIQGSTVDRLALKEFPSFPLQLPSLAEQKAVVSVLGALDDKIENNRRMNETLEEMARAIFKSWFVDFDPVHAKAAGNAPAHMDAETAALFPSSFGDDGLPAGWANKTLGDFVEIQNGYAFKSKDWADNGVPVVKIGSVKPSIVDLSKSSFVSEEIAEQKQNFRLEVGNILVGLTGYVGEVGRVPPSDIMPMLNQRVGRIIFKSNTFEPFIYAAMRLPEFKLFAESQSQGSAQANVSTKQLKEFRLIATENALIEKFNALTNSYFKKILNNFAESKTLAELRDTLLPKLMSGAIRLADAEREVEGAL